MGRLTTHVLDTAKGIPAADLEISLYRIENGSAVWIKTVHTNADGRVDHPLLDGGAFTQGHYQLDFKAGAYLKTSDTGFLDVIPIRFRISSPEEHYHVPLLLSPYGYTTYRGS